MSKNERETDKNKKQLAKAAENKKGAPAGKRSAPPDGNAAKPKAKQSAVRRIYVTTDGYFTSRSDIKKKRNIAVLEQRTDDGAIAVVKIYSKNGKEQKIGKTFIPGLTLSPDKHSALTEDSIVGREVIMGVKQSDKTYRPIYPTDFVSTSDTLTRKELKKVRKEAHNDTPEHKETFTEKLKRWFKHFKQ